MKDGNADMIKGQVCLDEMESGGNKRPKAVLRLKVRSGGRERGLWFHFAADSDIIGDEFGKHLGNVGLCISSLILLIDNFELTKFTAQT
jgi:hypothetical protein